MTPDGATYKGTKEEFLSGASLPLTDGVAGDDGAMYFLTGGRRLESGMYRVFYNGEDKGKEVENTAVTEGTTASKKAGVICIGKERGYRSYLVFLTTPRQTN